MRAYKLFRQRKDGTLSPLFINKKQVIPIGEWLEAEFHPTKGFAQRLGWHCCLQMVAPHLKLEPKNGLPRVWVEVELDGKIEEYNRPESQGGAWLLAERMKVIRIIN